MSSLSIETMSLRPTAPGEKARARAQDVANQFESVFVKTLVGSMRQTASIGGEDGMFGSGPGTDTYAGWFDDNMANELARSGGIGIAKMLMRDMERHGELDAQVEAADAGVRSARAADHERAAAGARGGIDVVR